MGIESLLRFYIELLVKSKPQTLGRETLAARKQPKHGKLLEKLRGFRQITFWQVVAVFSRSKQSRFFTILNRKQRELKRYLLNKYFKWIITIKKQWENNKSQRLPTKINKTFSWVKQKKGFPSDFTTTNNRKDSFTLFLTEFKQFLIL